MAPLLFLRLFLSLLLLAAADAAPASCSKATCGDHDIYYPFRLDSSASECGYPGLGLACENDTLILRVQSHRYRVFGINYMTHTISVSDEDVNEYANTSGCPRLHVNLTIDYTTSWLRLTSSDSNITLLYNCKKNISWPSALELSGCQEYDGKRSYVLPDGMITGAEAYEYECEEVVVAPVLGVHKEGIVGAPGGPPPENGSFREVLLGGFELMYSTHSQQCDGCESSGGWCGYQRNETYGGLRFSCFCDGGPTTARCTAGKIFGGVGITDVNTSLLVSDSIFSRVAFFHWVQSKRL